jgi:hypothetical protein
LPIAAESDQVLVPAPVTLGAKNAMFQQSALEVVLEFLASIGIIKALFPH